MTRFSSVLLPPPTLSLLAAVCLAGLPLAATALLAGPAYADNGYNHADGGGRRGRPDHHRGPPPPAFYGGYYSQPDPYYAAPPIIVAPSPYYQQPAPGINFVFPLVIR